MTTPARPLPTPTPETREYWDGLKRHELRLQRCRACHRAYFYPRPFCPYPGCHSQAVEWSTASRRGGFHFARRVQGGGVEIVQSRDRGKTVSVSAHYPELALSPPLRVARTFHDFDPLTMSGAAFWHLAPPADE